MLSRGKQIGFAVALTFFFLAVTLGLMELAVRHFRPQPTYSKLLAFLEGERYVPSPVIPFTLAPNYPLTGPSHEHPGQLVRVTTNRWGMRGRDVSQQKPAGTKRILILGDSYTFGLYVNDDETYPAVLERLLR